MLDRHYRPVASRVFHGLVCALLLCGASRAEAQTEHAKPAAEPLAATVATPAPGIDPDRLPVSLDRVRRELAGAPPTISFVGLKLAETVNVVGVAPPLTLFDEAEANLVTGPVPYGAPTHRDFIERVTPAQYRTPAMDISALIEWLLEQLGEQAR